MSALLSVSLIAIVAVLVVASLVLIAGTIAGTFGGEGR